ncbi:hypothetical protein [Hymenobacter sp. B81]|uniref:hypothetical protein n=1 Tax=Hymenobacter sp. B81 TaxID=3344878 RepID=UPI0037DC8CDF
MSLLKFQTDDAPDQLEVSLTNDAKHVIVMLSCEKEEDARSVYHSLVNGIQAWPSSDVKKLEEAEPTAQVQTITFPVLERDMPLFRAFMSSPMQEGIKIIREESRPAGGNVNLSSTAVTVEVEEDESIFHFGVRWGDFRSAKRGGLSHV